VLLPVCSVTYVTKGRGSEKAFFKPDFTPWVMTMEKAITATAKIHCLRLENNGKNSNAKTPQVIMA